ncbi:MAG: VanZ family protein [Patescibacteria group bacterium]|nr:VanZ family protein [Patescibacteria group bacterium]
MQKRKIIQIIAYWLPALIWAGVIFYLSNQPGLRIGLTTPNEILARKIAHALEFGVLAWLIWRLTFYCFNVETRKAVFLAGVLAILFAASDEFHQMFVVDRSGNVADILVDSIGVLLTLHVIVPLYIRKFKIWMVGSFGLLVVVLVLLINSMVIDAKQIVSHKQTWNKLQFQIAKKMSQKDQQDVIEEKETEVIQEEVSVEIISQEQNELPKNVIIDVPFTSQAPFGVWDYTHEEACEEASLIMVKYYLDKKKLSPQIAENEIQSLKQYQMKKYGRFEDSDMEELVDIAFDYYDLNNLKIVYDFSPKDLKEALAKNNPIIVPTAGRQLGNPFFTQPGPLYHNLVLVGYNGNKIITNDPGTKRGEGFEYDLNVLFDSIHDFPGDKNKITQGRKVMVVIDQD